MIIWLEKRKIASLIFTLLIAIEIFFFSTISFAPGKGGISFFSIIYHFIAFFLFNFFLFATIKGKREVKINHILIVLFISIIYAILDEVHQIFVPYRDASIKDVLIDSLGIFTSMIVYLYINKKQKKKVKQSF